MPQHLQSRVIHDRLATRQVRALFGTWCALPVFAEFGKRPDLLYLMSADCTVRELQSLNGAVQSRMQVATRTTLPDITRLAEKHHRFFFGERLCECSSCVRILLVDWNSVPWSPAYAASMLPAFFPCCEAPSGQLTVCPTAGAQALTVSSLMTWYPCHSGPASSFFLSRRDELPAF